MKILVIHDAVPGNTKKIAPFSLGDLNLEGRMTAGEQITPAYLKLMNLF